jgi:hypothetical protein
MGGRPSSEPLNLAEHTPADWEVLVDALTLALAARGVLRTDEHRRVMEDMPADKYLSLNYYERWSYVAEQLLVEKGILTHEDVDRKQAELEPTWGVS